jgi:ornithine carbamoyltransferase
MLDYTPEEINYLLTLAATLKADKKAGKEHRYHTGKNVVLLFEKTPREPVVRLKSER